MDIFFGLLQHLLAPVAPLSVEEAIGASASAVLLTLLSCYALAVAASWSKDFTRDRRLWTARASITLAYLQGVMATAVLWTLVIGYCHYRGSFEGWSALIPYWSGLFCALLIAAVLLYRLRREVAGVQRATAV